MQPYRETLWPSPWVIIALALVVPATMLVLAPVSLAAGIVGAVVLYGGCLALAFGTAPRIQVSESSLSVGKASIPLGFIGEVVVYTGTDATAQLRTKLDARAWLMIRGWVHSLVKVEIVDPADPTPYWLLSSRRPQALADAIAAARTHA
ncbi:DUF3093 domain-containing protein [Plantibacter sp. VKM Ac-2885]|jgi:hypothetical protein|uniref:Uncharacterized protein n=2 Tax=Plantibacter TaxID=190323 RepID=A0A3N2C2Q0_9MICO|nr:MULTISPECIES: DUF3093 domain-containing protein [Plantibacter]AZH83802.1 DUF3093 domain-containing protein [Plantibacter sp. PA-3-X8]MBD8102925.1 DUF3093 domain-containing protein [Plantibacter sp. CFBP 8775]MBD8515603.1 DUF3093 domain-containing protein [Plantibacter sp. CFBP 8804]MBD8534261.1 DUF3093 domain-containing protein [Plantibacter sp. CFBP 13570]MBF4512981.1 DUF3093 domain-containing protein [Plantibacter sp. VKM Ac-2885]